MTGYTTYTALYDDQGEAKRTQDELQRLGIIEESGHAVFGGDAHKAGGFWDDHKGVAPPQADRRLYEEGVKRGGYLLTVNVEDRYAEQVGAVLDGSKAVDIDAREAEYVNEGVLPAAAAAAPLAAPTGSDEAIQVVEERLKIGKRQVERGNVRVRAYVVETPVTEQVNLREEHVTLERRPVETVLPAGTDAFRDRELSLTERSEEAVVAKDARVVEEVALSKVATERTEEVVDTVRHTEVEVEQLPGAATRRP